MNFPTIERNAEAALDRAHFGQTDAAWREDLEFERILADERLALEFPEAFGDLSGEAQETLLSALAGKLAEAAKLVRQAGPAKNAADAELALQVMTANALILGTVQGVAEKRAEKRLETLKAERLGGRHDA
jgi:hypothetical protein